MAPVVEAMRAAGRHWRLHRHRRSRWQVVGTGGMAGAIASNGGIGGGLNCGNRVPVTTTVFTDFEYLSDAPFIEFTSPTGFRGTFFGDNEVNGSTFAVATGADAHSPGHALKVTTANTGFVEIGPNFAGRKGCLDLVRVQGHHLLGQGERPIAFEAHRRHAPIERWAI